MLRISRSSLACLAVVPLNCAQDVRPYSLFQDFTLGPKSSYNIPASLPDALPTLPLTAATTAGILPADLRPRTLRTMIKLIALALCSLPAVAFAQNPALPQRTSPAAPSQTPPQSTTPASTTPGGFIPTVSRPEMPPPSTPSGPAPVTSAPSTAAPERPASTPVTSAAPPSGLPPAVTGGVLATSQRPPAATEPSARPAAAAANPSYGITWEQSPFYNWIEIARQVHEKLNQARNLNGLTPLAWSNDLAYLSILHSNDMAVNNFLGHDSQENLSIGSRAQQQGITCSFDYNNLHFSSFSENVFYVNTWTERTIVYSGTNAEGQDVFINHYIFRTPENIVDEAVQGWMNSPSHKANILAPQSQRHGIGIGVGKDGKIYFTQSIC